MIYDLLAGLAAAAIIWQVRYYRLARNPAAWPRTISFEKQVKLARTFLKHDGWQMLETNRPMNIFIRGKRDSLWLTMMVHGGEGTLTLPTLMKDCISKHAGNGLIMGILSQDSLSSELQTDAARNGIYVINPVELKDVASHIRRAIARQQQVKAALTSENADAAAKPLERQGVA